MNNSWFKPAPVVSIEAIEFQTADVLCRELKVLVEEYRYSKEQGGMPVKRNEVFAELAAKSISKRIKAKKVILDVNQDDTTYNAYAYPPDLVKSSVLIKSYFGMMEQAAAGKASVKKDASAIGWVDLRKAELGGVFCDIPIRIGIYTAVIGNSLLTPEEAVSIIMHEIGHVMSYYEMLSTTISSALVLQDSVNRLMNTRSDKERVKVINKIEEDYDLKFANPDMLLELDTTEAITVNVMSEIGEKIRSEFGSTIYDIRSWESISDQFASRMGCTVALATGLEKILRQGEPSSYMGAFTFYTMEVIKTLVLIGSMGALMAAGPAGIVINLLCISIMAALNPHHRVYDRPRERIVRLRNETVLKMKKKDIPMEIRKSLENDVQVIDAILANMTDRETFFEKVWLILSPETRRQKKLTKELQDLEGLVSNDLFSRSNSLKIMQGN